jgi:hypothetical protein
MDGPLAGRPSSIIRAGDLTGDLRKMSPEKINQLVPDTTY